MIDEPLRFAATGVGLLAGLWGLLVLHEHCHSAAYRLAGVRSEIVYEHVRVLGVPIPFPTSAYTTPCPLHRGLTIDAEHRAVVALAPIVLLTATPWLPALVFHADTGTEADIWDVLIVTGGWLAIFGPSPPDWINGVFPGRTKLALADLEEQWLVHAAAEGVPVDWDPDARRERHPAARRYEQLVETTRARLAEAIAP